MPHSPRFYRGKLWVLNSGAGEFGYVDLERGRFEPVTFCPGYLRGLVFQDNLAIVGLSKPRDRTFAGLPLAEQLATKDAEARCGLRFIDLNSGHIIHWLDLEGIVTELYDVQVLPGIRRPMALGFRTDDIGQVITIEQPPSFLLHHLVSTEVLSSDHSTGPIAPPSPPAAATTSYQFQLHQEISLEVALLAYEPLTFPSLQQKAQSKALQEPLLAVTATQQGRLVGVALAEIRADKSSAELLSLFVEPIHRRKGVGTGLLAQLEQALSQRDCHYIDVVYRTHWASLAAIERLLQKQGWTSPQTRMLLCKTGREKIMKAPWLRQYLLPSDFTIFPWSELSPQERQAIEQQQAVELWYPPELTPFQEEEKIESLNSLGLRYQGQVVGWMITHRLRSDLIQYTSLFVRQDLQRLGRAIPLIVEAIRRHVASPIPYGIFMIDVQNRPMVNFLERRLQPYLISQAESRAARRWLR
jgi:GNAT superfamily N-acetyltransferase